MKTSPAAFVYTLLARTFWSLLGAALLPMVAQAQFGPPTGNNVVVYNPAFTQQQQGIQPFHTFYDLTITAPGSLSGSRTISMVLIVEEAPAGVDQATASSFISFVDPATGQPKNVLMFSGPNTSQTVRVKTDIPLGSDDGNFKYLIKTSGWPSNFVDNGTRINAQAALPSGVQAPIVSITTPEEGAEFTYVLGGPPVEVPIRVAGAASPSAPVLTLTATLSGVDDDGVPFMIDMPLSLGYTGLGTPDTVGDVTVPLDRGGTYTITAEATNAIGESFTSSTFIIVQEVPPPVVVINPPTNNPTYTYVRGLTSVSVPYAFVGSTLQGEILSLTATLDGEPFTPDELEGIGELIATGTGEFVFDANTPDGVGEHTISVTATTEYGSATASATFVVAEQVPTISVDINQPTDGASISLPPDASPLSLPFSFTGSATHGAPVTAISATITTDDETTAVTLSNASGLNTPSATGNGTLTHLQPGEYTLSVSAINSTLGLSAFDSVTFQVTPPPPPTIVFTQAPEASYTTLKGYSLSIPFSIRTSSTGAYIKEQSVTLDGDLVSITSNANGTALVAEGSGTLQIPALSAGTTVYTLVAIGTDVYGETVTTETEFSVTVNDPVITIAINPQIAANSPYTLPNNGSLQIPFTFTGKITAGATVDSITGDLGGTAVTISSSSGIGTSSTATASGTLSISAPGTYTLTATDTNNASGVSATTSVTFQVIKASTPPPKLTVTITQAPQAVYTVFNLCDPICIPIAFTGKSSDSKVKTLSATLDGKSVSLSSTSGLNTATAKATAKLNVKTTGTHVLVVKATDNKGQVVTESVTFQVKVVKPEISVSIDAPVQNAVYMLPSTSGYCNGSSISIPFSFTSTITQGATVDSISATLNGSSVSVSKSGIGTSKAKGTGTLKISKPGTYTFTAKGRDDKAGISATKSVTFVVRTAQPPTVTITSPTTTNYTIFDCTPRSISFGFKATSDSSTITKLSAKLDGQSLNVTASGIGTANATGSGTMSVKSGGKHVLTVSATDKTGTTSKSFTFYVTVEKANPRVSIGGIEEGAVITYTSDLPKIPFTITGTSNAAISSLKAKLNGSELNFSKTGIGTEKATGNGTLSVSGAGSYTLTATVVSGGVSATAKVTFTVKKTQAPNCTVDWKGDITKGESPKGGSTFRIKCEVKSGSKKMRDSSVTFAICEIDSKGNYGKAKLYSSSSYWIEKDEYCLNFPTDKGQKRYRVEVYYGNGSSKPCGTKEFKTR